MNKLVAILALTATVMSASALTANAAYAAQKTRAQATETYTLDGKVVSQDPDAFIRQQSLREAESGGADR